MCDTIFMSPAMQCNKLFIVQTEESLNIFFLKNNSGQGKKTKMPVWRFLRIFTYTDEGLFRLGKG